MINLKVALLMVLIIKREVSGTKAAKLARARRVESCVPQRNATVRNPTTQIAAPVVKWPKLRLAHLNPPQRKEFSSRATLGFISVSNANVW